jgi:hypothetical protein
MLSSKRTKSAEGWAEIVEPRIKRPAPSCPKCQQFVSLDDPACCCVDCHAIIRKLPLLPSLARKPLSQTALSRDVVLAISPGSSSKTRSKLQPFLDRLLPAELFVWHVGCLINCLMSSPVMSRQSSRKREHVRRQGFRQRRDALRSPAYSSSCSPRQG